MPSGKPGRPTPACPCMRSAPSGALPVRSSSGAAPLNVLGGSIGVETLGSVPQCTQPPAGRVAHVGFFDDLPTPPGPEPDVRPPQPEWAGPAEGVVPGVSYTRLILHRSDRLAVVVHRFLVYPTGVSFSIRVMWPPGAGIDMNEIDMAMMGRGRRGAQALRFGVAYPDGSKATNQDWPTVRGEQNPPGPLLIEHGGSGSDGEISRRLWMWPLPPPGELTFALAWEEMELPECVGSIDSADLIRASQDAITLW